MKADYVHKDTLTATDYVELNKNNELLMSYNQALLKENHELKKQLEEYKQEKQEWINLLDMFKNQQKEFIEYLENEITQYGGYKLILYKETLSKYKEIIGTK